MHEKKGCGWCKKIKECHQDAWTMKFLRTPKHTKEFGTYYIGESCKTFEGKEIWSVS